MAQQNSRGALRAPICGRTAARRRPRHSTARQVPFGGWPQRPDPPPLRVQKCDPTAPPKEQRHTLATPDVVREHMASHPLTPTLCSTTLHRSLQHNTAATHLITARGGGGAGVLGSGGVRSGSRVRRNLWSLAGAAGPPKGSPGSPVSPGAWFPPALAGRCSFGGPGMVQHHLWKDLIPICPKRCCIMPGPPYEHRPVRAGETALPGIRGPARLHRFQASRWRRRSAARGWACVCPGVLSNSRQCRDPTLWNCGTVELSHCYQSDNRPRLTMSCTVVLSNWPSVETFRLGTSTVRLARAAGRRGGGSVEAAVGQQPLAPPPPLGPDGRIPAAEC
eukprot:gene25146-biopygen10492